MDPARDVGVGSGLGRMAAGIAAAAVALGFACWFCSRPVSESQAAQPSREHRTALPPKANRAPPESAVAMRRSSPPVRSTLSNGVLIPIEIAQRPGTKRVVAIEALPPVVRAAAEDILGGMELIEAEKEARGEDVVFDIRGRARSNGNLYAMQFTDAGKLTNVQTDDDAEGRPDFRAERTRDQF